MSRISQSGERCGASLPFQDGSAFRSTADGEKLRRQIEVFEPRDVAGYQRLRAELDSIHETCVALVDKPLTRVSDDGLPVWLAMRSGRTAPVTAEERAPRMEGGPSLAGTR